MHPLQQPSSDFLATAAGQIVQYGVLGVIALTFAYAILKLWASNERVQQARVDDAKANTTASNELLSKAVAAITANTSATETGTEAVKELRDALRRNP